MPSINKQTKHYKTQYKFIAGCDEVGRGPLAGAVIAAAVILPEKYKIDHLADSKTLTTLQREKAYLQITEQAISYSIGRAEVLEIDTINILQASLLAMTRAINSLQIQPEFVLIDGNKIPKGMSIPAEAVVQGDQLEHCISAASIIAKVTRDREMLELAKLYPEYGFATNKGYGTKEHLIALKQFGATVIHRRSFAPVREAIQAVEIPEHQI